MLKPTKYGLKEYIKAIRICASGRFERFEESSVKGSAHRFELFQKEKDSVPSEFWVIHFEHSKKKRIYPRDFKKTYYHLGISEEHFLAVIDNL